MANRNYSSLKTQKTQWCASPAILTGCQCSLDLNPPPKRPDPAIYSQAARLAAGLDVTWENPDIKWFTPPTYQNGEWQRGPQLLLDHVEISIHNRSATAAAINAVVTVSRANFGIGMKRTPVATQLISIAAGQTNTFNTSLGTSMIEVMRGGEALYVDISHPYDADRTNNHGESVVQLVTNRAATQVPISIGNYTDQPLVYILSLGPNNLAAQLSDTQVAVGPGTNNQIGLSFAPPPAHPSDSSVTVFAHDLQGNLLGGLTVHLYV